MGRGAGRYGALGAGLAAMLPLTGLSAQTAVKGVPAIRPDQAPAATPKRGVAPRAAPVARKADAAITPFVLTAMRIDGATLPPATLAAVSQSYVGRTIDNAALTAITNAMAAAYAANDRALYTILVPEQGFAGGVLHLIAVEGYVGAVEVRGHLRRNRLKLLRAYLRRLEQERPLHTSTLQRVVSLIRDMPGFFPEISFEPGTAQGAVKLVLVAREAPFQLSAGANNRGTALLGRTQGQVDVVANAIFGGADQLRLTGILPSHTSLFQYGGAAYTTPLNANGTTATANISYLRTRPKAFPLKGDAISFGGQLSHPIVRGYTKSLYVTAGVDGINSNNALLGFTLSNDRVRTARLGLSFTTSSQRNQLSLSATASQGLDILGARFVPGLSRQGFRKLNLKANEAVQVGRSFVLRANAFAQLTADDLPSSEQVALGGDEFGRAYQGALISGDTGYAGLAEFAWRPERLPKLVAGSEFYAFADHGHVRYRSRFGRPAVTNHLGSVGFGGRMQIAAKTVLQLEAARGLNDPVFYEDHTRTRLRFSIRTVL